MKSTLLIPSHAGDGESSHHFAPLISGSLCDRQGNNQNPIRGPSCQMSSFRLQEMDVLHFTVHNICRDNHSTPQRACAAVLKLSIVLVVMSLAFFGRPTGGPGAEGV